MKENNRENNSTGAIWVRQRSGRWCFNHWILQTLPKIKKFSVLCVQTTPSPPKQGTKGINMSTNGSYHINHSNKVVHLKWGVKRSLILPRSSCFKTKTCRCVGTGWWLETGGHRGWKGGFSWAGHSGCKNPGLKSPAQCGQFGPSSQDPAMSTGFPPKDGHILKPHSNLESQSWGVRPLGLGIPDTS